jgi:hypothetical protein
MEATPVAQHELPPNADELAWTRWDQIRVRFEKFHAERPDVYVMFKKFTFQTIKVGHKHYGSAGIFERMRWETNVNRFRQGNTFKLNNDFKQFYTRMFNLEFPHLKGFFHIRKPISKRKPPVYGPELGPDDYAPDYD